MIRSQRDEFISRLIRFCDFAICSQLLGIECPKTDNDEVAGLFQSFPGVNGRAGSLGSLGGSSFDVSEPVFVKRHLFRELILAWLYKSLW